MYGGGSWNGHCCCASRWHSPGWSCRFFCRPATQRTRLSTRRRTSLRKSTARRWSGTRRVTGKARRWNVSCSSSGRRAWHTSFSMTGNSPPRTSTGYSRTATCSPCGRDLIVPHKKRPLVTEGSSFVRFATTLSPSRRARCSILDARTPTVRT